MTNRDREELKEQLRAMIAGRGDGIDLDTPFTWVIEGVTQPAKFFEHLAGLLPPDCVLYVEGTTIVSEVSSFYATHRAPNAVEVARDTISPVPEVFHFVTSPEVYAGLRSFSERLPVSEMFDHIKGYQGEKVLFTFHDAFTGELRLSEHLAEEAIDDLCQALGVSRRREETKRRNPEHLRAFLWALENPEKVRIAGEPWWQRLRKRLIGR